MELPRILSDSSIMITLPVVEPQVTTYKQHFAPFLFLDIFFIISGILLEAAGTQEVRNIVLNFLDRSKAFIEQACSQSQKRNLHVFANFHELVNTQPDPYVPCVRREQHGINVVVLDSLSQIVNNNVNSSLFPDESSELQRHFCGPN